MFGFLFAGMHQTFFASQTCASLYQGATVPSGAYNFKVNNGIGLVAGLFANPCSAISIVPAGWSSQNPSIAASIPAGATNMSICSPCFTDLSNSISNPGGFGGYAMMADGVTQQFICVVDYPNSSNATNATFEIVPNDCPSTSICPLYGAMSNQVPGLPNNPVNPSNTSNTNPYNPYIFKNVNTPAGTCPSASGVVAPLAAPVSTPLSCTVGSVPSNGQCAPCPTSTCASLDNIVCAGNQTGATYCKSCQASACSSLDNQKCAGTQTGASYCMGCPEGGTYVSQTNSCLVPATSITVTNKLSGDRTYKSPLPAQLQPQYNHNAISVNVVCADGSTAASATIQPINIHKDSNAQQVFIPSTCTNPILNLTGVYEWTDKSTTQPVPTIIQIPIQSSNTQYSLSGSLSGKTISYTFHATP